MAPHPRRQPRRQWQNQAVPVSIHHHQEFNMAINVTIDPGYEFEARARAAAVFAVVPGQSSGAAVRKPVEGEA